MFFVFFKEMKNSKVTFKYPKFIADLNLKVYFGSNSTIDTIRPGETISLSARTHFQP